MLLFSLLLIFLNPTVLMLTPWYFFLLTIKVVQDTSSLTISFTHSGSLKSCGAENKTPQNNQFSGKNIFYFCHLSKKLIMGFGFPKYQWGSHNSVSQVFASVVSLVSY